MSRLRQLLGDHFDFIAVIHMVTTRANRNYNGVRNDVRGIGASIFDVSNRWNVEPGRLQGVIEFPIDWFFDGAEGPMVHEIGHHFGLSDEEACMEVSRFESLVSKCAIDRMCQAMGHPSRGGCGEITHDTGCLGPGQEPA